MEVTVKHNFLKRSPHKVRPTLYIIRNKKVDDALNIMKFSDKGVSKELFNLIKAGISAAKEKELEIENLYVKAIAANEGAKLKRYIFKARGRTARITKRMCHLVLTLSDQPLASKKKDAKTPKVKKDIAKGPATVAKAVAKSPKKDEKE